MGDEPSCLCTLLQPWLVFFVFTYLVSDPAKDFKLAQAQFERILAIDPHRVEDIDIYSNILYVTDNRLKLSRLATEFLTLDRDRPEVCCLVGV